MKSYLKVVETLDGGDLVLKGNDLEGTDSILNHPYIALFGGNFRQSTEDVGDQDETRYDWWGNDTILRNQISTQINSSFERSLNEIPISSEGISLLEDIVLKDLSFMSDIADVSVSITALSSNSIKVSISIKKPESLTDDVYTFIWNGTIIENKDLIEN
ncbi:MAG: hypothetical protein HRU26_07525 [Psychroserpens sp.]|nr:hypothetical protein [Psychroserpens sp.]